MIEFKDLIDKSKNLYSLEVKRHNDTNHPINILLFLVDNGVTKNDGLKVLYEEILKNNFSVVLNIPTHYGGTGIPSLSWMMCDLPVLIYIAIKLNCGEIEKVHRDAIEGVLNLRDIDKWKCQCSPNLGTFRGPGRKDDECPITTVNILKMLSLTEKEEYKQEKKLVINIIINLWKERKNRRPYLFAMGTDFRKLKYPLIWYDLLNVLNVLSNYSEAVKTEEYQEMLTILKTTIKDNGYKPQSVYQSWKGSDFGQKKTDSEYIKKIVDEIELKSEEIQFNK